MPTFFARVCQNFRDLLGNDVRNRSIEAINCQFERSAVTSMIFFRAESVIRFLISIITGSDRSDNISFQEFKRGVAMAGVRPVPGEQEMRALFASFDINDDREVSYQEMVAALEREYGGAGGKGSKSKQTSAAPAPPVPRLQLPQLVPKQPTSARGVSFTSARVYGSRSHLDPANRHRHRTRRAHTHRTRR